MTVEASTRVKGGEFLISSGASAELFTPEDFTDEQRMIGETLQRFVDEELRPRLEEIEKQDTQLTVELLKKAAELGLLGIEVPERYGGLGLDKASSTIVAEKLSPVGSFAVSYGAHCGIGTLPLVYFGSEDQKQQFLPKLTTGELIAA